MEICIRPSYDEHVARRQDVTRQAITLHRPSSARASPNSISVSDRLESTVNAARAGDEEAFAHLAEPLRKELLVHCYRLLGSVHEAEDMVQEAFLRAWRGIDKFEPRASFRAWLYKIATNICLDVLRVRRARTLPASVYPAADPREPTAEHTDEVRWLEPFPDAGPLDMLNDPEARYVRREYMSLAFIAALQRLPVRQRATLILRDVLDWRANEVAELLTMTVPAVNSALNRARTTMAKYHVTNGTLPSLTDQRLVALVKEFVDAMDAGDLPRLIATLTSDARWIMPPLSTWYQGRDAIGKFLGSRVFAAGARGISRRRVLTRANGQPALALYHQAPVGRVYEAFALQVLTIDDLAWQIAEVTTFLNRDLFEAFGLPLEIPM